MNSFIDTPELTDLLLRHGYKYVRQLGRGGFASVFLATSIKYQNAEFAIKRVHHAPQSSSATDTAAYDKEINSEIEALLELSHPLIIKMYEYFTEDDSIYIVLEYCNNGTMGSLIKNNGPLDTYEFFQYAKRLLEVLSYCHANKIAHRDIKPDNIFIDKYNRIRLADFGLAHKFDEIVMSSSTCGSLMFAAPEIITKKCKDPFACDVYSLGVTFYYMVTGEYPFPMTTREDIVAAITMGQIHFPSKLDTRIKCLIAKMTPLLPKRRFKVDDLLDSPEFQVSPKISSSFLSKSSYGGSFGDFAITKDEWEKKSSDGIRAMRSNISSINISLSEYSTNNNSYTNGNRSTRFQTAKWLSQCSSANDDNKTLANNQKKTATTEESDSDQNNCGKEVQNFVAHIGMLPESMSMPIKKKHVHAFVPGLNKTSRGPTMRRFGVIVTAVRK